MIIQIYYFKMQQYFLKSYSQLLTTYQHTIKKIKNSFDNYSYLCTNYFFMKKLSVIELDRVSKEEFKTIDKTPLVVVLDNIRSLNNVGSVFRSSDAFKLEKIYLCGVTATPPNAEIHKTALGAEDSMEWEYEEDTKAVVAKLKQEGYKIFAVEQVQNSIMLDRVELDKTNKYVLILGNEVKGVQQEVVDMCDFAVEIPQFGTKHSLNVSVAAGIVIWEFFKKLQ